MPETTQRESDRLARFFYRISNPSAGFRQEVLGALQEIFGYERVTFWLSDSDDMLTDPIFDNVDQYIMYSYQDLYFQFDPFFYRNLRRSAKRRPVLLLKDVADPVDYYQNNVYYQEVLQSYRFTEKMAFYLKSGSEFLGGISVLRTDSEPKFSEKDQQLASILNNYISNLLLLHRKIGSLSLERDQLQHFAEESQDGLVIVDETGKILFANASARRSVESLEAAGLTGSLDEFVGRTLKKTACSRDWHSPERFFQIGGYSVCSCVHGSGSRIRHLIFLSKEPESGALPEQISCRPGQPLTAREREVLRCLLDGMSNQQIATGLLISEPTVKTHLSHIYEKYNVANRGQLICKLK